MRTLSNLVSESEHRMTLDTVVRTPDLDGGFVETWLPLDPPFWWSAIQPMASDSRHVADTVQASATHVLKGVYHPTLTIGTRVTFGARQFLVRSVLNLDERRIRLEVQCSEVVRA